MPLFEDAAWRKKFRDRLLRWYRKSQRDLPWRKSSDPYSVWVSEIMLQQTQVTTVKEYFTRFIKRFPTVAKLASAPEADVLRFWEGLGYYRRARQLHAAAKLIVANHNGQFPDDFEEVVALPGIGRYTAGAVLSIALDQRQPILEANTIRLLARLSAYREDPTKSAGQRWLWRFAEELLPRRNCGQFNQALMELGSLVCTPHQPTCTACPAAKLCPTNEFSLQASIPARTKKLEYEVVTEAAVVIRKQQRVLLRECEAGERWAGLWDFPRFSVGAGIVPANDRLQRHLLERVERDFGMQVAIAKHLNTMKHGVTKYRITLHSFTAEPLHGQRIKKPAVWVSLSELDDYPLSVTGRKIGKLLS